VKWFFVIARNSSFAYKGRAVDVKQLARELGVRYVLEGSVHKAGRRVRITGQLIQAETRQHLWANRFDGELADVFELQDQVTASVVAAIEPSIVDAAIEKTLDMVRNYRVMPADLIEVVLLTASVSLPDVTAYEVLAGMTRAQSQDPCCVDFRNKLERIAARLIPPPEESETVREILIRAADQGIEERST
jgi:hypothetical protein